MLSFVPTFDIIYFSFFLFFSKGPQSGFIYRSLLSYNEICARYIRGPESFDMCSFYVLFWSLLCFKLSLCFSSVLRF